jgi:NAD(P)-dependent dehydrogenase (short-subunit alcohol dehydrogenase family)
MSRFAFLLCIFLGTTGVARTQEAPPRATGGAQPKTVLVTGSNRGLGLEFVAQYAAAGWTVIATARNPDDATELRALATRNPKIAVERLDVIDQASIDALAAKYRGKPIDVLLNNAGVLGGGEGQTLGSFDYAAFENVMAVNVYGPLAVAEAFTEHVAASGEKKIVSITSRSGVISEPGRRGPYFYRASKVALNMVMRVLADDLRERGVIVALVAPYPTDTDMLRALIGPQNAARQARPADSVAALIKVIDGLTLGESPQAWLADGTRLPW